MEFGALYMALEQVCTGTRCATCICTRIPTISVGSPEYQRLEQNFFAKIAACSATHVCFSAWACSLHAIRYMRVLSRYKRPRAALRCCTSARANPAGIPAAAVHFQAAASYVPTAAGPTANELLAAGWLARTSRYAHVYWDRLHGHWRAMLSRHHVQGKTLHGQPVPAYVGVYTDDEAAAGAVDDRLLMLLGDTAPVNLPRADGKGSPRALPPLSWAWTGVSWKPDLAARAAVQGSAQGELLQGAWAAGVPPSAVEAVARALELRGDGADSPFRGPAADVVLQLLRAQLHSKHANSLLTLPGFVSPESAAVVVDIAARAAAQATGTPVLAFTAGSRYARKVVDQGQPAAPAPLLNFPSHAEFRRWREERQKLNTTAQPRSSVLLATAKALAAGSHRDQQQQFLGVAHESSAGMGKSPYPWQVRATNAQHSSRVVCCAASIELAAVLHDRFTLLLRGTEHTGAFNADDMCAVHAPVLARLARCGRGPALTLAQLCAREGSLAEATAAIAQAGSAGSPAGHSAALAASAASTTTAAANLPRVTMTPSGKPGAGLRAGRWSSFPYISRGPGHWIGRIQLASIRAKLGDEAAEGYSARGYTVTAPTELQALTARELLLSKLALPSSLHVMPLPVYGTLAFLWAAAWDALSAAQPYWQHQVLPSHLAADSNAAAPASSLQDSPVVRVASPKDMGRLHARLARARPCCRIPSSSLPSALDAGPDSHPVPSAELLLLATPPAALQLYELAQAASA